MWTVARDLALVTNIPLRSRRAFPRSDEIAPNTYPALSGKASRRRRLRRAYDTALAPDIFSRNVANPVIRD